MIRLSNASSVSCQLWVSTMLNQAIFTLHLSETFNIIIIFFVFFFLKNVLFSFDMSLPLCSKHRVCHAQ